MATYSPNEKLPVTVEIRVAGSWLEITSTRRQSGNLRLKHGRGSGAVQAEGSRCWIDIGNDDAYLTEGNPLSPWGFGRGTEIRVSVLGTPKFSGAVDDYDIEFTSATTCVAHIEAIGLLCEVAANEDPLRSAPYRYLTGLTSTVPVAAWTLEDGTLVASGAPLYGSAALVPFVGVHPSGAVISYPKFGRGTLASWLPAVANCSSSGGLSILSAHVSMPAFTNTWAIDFAYNSGSDGPISSVDVNPSYLGGSLGWPQLSLDPSVGTVSVAFDGSPETVTSAPSIFDGRLHHIRWIAQQVAGNVLWSVQLDGNLIQSGTELTFVLPAITEFAMVAESGSAAISIGYPTIWTTAVPVDDFTDAVFGHQSEQGHERAARLFDEEDLTLVVYGDSSATMGPQRTAPLWDLLLDIEDADQGLFFDATDDRAAAYRTLEHLCNQTPRIAVTKGALTKDLRPRWDRQRLVNDWTLSRIDGATVTVSDEDHVAAIGRRVRRSLGVSLELDDDLESHASWRVAAGTAAGPRYSEGGLNLRNNDGATLADSILALLPGDRFTAADAALPPAHPPGGFDQMVLGWEEILDARRWLVYPNMVPSAPFHLTGRWDLESQVLHTALTTTATTADVAGTDVEEPLWGTDVGSGFDWDIDGEKVRVTAIAASLATFGTTGVVAHAVNANVTPGIPASVATGDLLLVYAAIRNSGAGVPTAPAGYTRTEIFPATSNAQVFAKIATSGAEAAPTVSFTGGVALADTSAQMIRLGGKWHDVNNIVLWSASCLNASAQDIAVPGLPTPDADNGVAMFFGWKADDWTSVTSPGTEIGEPDTTTGDDQGIVWAYTIQTTAANVTSPNASFFVTGGAAAISRGAVAVIRCDYQTATIERSINGVVATHAAGASVSLWDPMLWGV